MSQPSQGVTDGQTALRYLHDNPQLYNKLDFYATLSISTLQQLIALAFQHQRGTAQQLHTLVTLLKRNTFIIALAFSHKQFTPMAIFKPLWNSSTTFQNLSTLEEILLPFAKKSPGKIMAVIAREVSFQKQLEHYLSSQSIFKIQYTTVFCLSKEQLTLYRHEVEIILQTIVACPKLRLTTIDHRQIVSEAQKYPLSSYGTMLNSLRDMLNDITINIASVQVQAVTMLIALINHSYLQQLMQCFLLLNEDPQHEEYCQGIVIIFTALLKLLETITFAWEDQDKKKQVVEGLLALGKSIAATLEHFIASLLVKPTEQYNSSSGQRIYRVGLLKHRVLQLIQCVLYLNEICDLDIVYPSFDFFLVVQKYLIWHKWNNIVHISLAKIVEILMSQDYPTFRKRYIEDQQKAEQFFGALIQNFRNTKYVHLSTMTMANMGNRQAIYQISKCIVNEMQKCKDLTLLIQQFPHWKVFMQKDMKLYESVAMATSNYFDEHVKLKPQLPRNSICIPNNFLTPSQSISHHPLKTIEEVLNHLEEEKKWSPRMYERKPRMEKLDFQSNIRQIDSMKDTLL